MKPTAMSQSRTRIFLRLIPFFLWLAQPALAHASLELFAFVAGRGAAVESRPSWLSGGFGRLDLGAAAAQDDDTFAVAEAQAALTWQPSRFFGAYLHVVGRAEPDRREGSPAGVVEAYIQGAVDFRRRDTLKLRLGHFLLPTSRENVEGAWSSPYTLTFSAINSWIGQEMRLTGLLTEARLASGRSDEVRLGATIFGGNDSLGAFLAWRGWTLGNRLATYDETLPLPPIDSLAPGRAFDVQHDQGTRPFDRDLDGRPGWAAYLAWHRPERFVVQLSHLDNRGDRGLYRGEYAWRTELDLLGVELHLGSLSLVAEATRGSTGMGLFNRPHVQMDFAAAYGLISWRPRSFRVTVRYDTFEGTERDFTDADLNDDDGEAWTVAWFWEPDDTFRLGLEYLDLESRRPEAAASGFDPDTRARSLMLEARYYFGL